MAKQTVTLRLDQDDLAYLSQVEITGAANLSEKIRALIAEARTQRQGSRDYLSAHDFARQLIARVERQINAAEIDATVRSELIHRILAWLPEALAYALSAGQVMARANDQTAGLRALEHGLAERTFSLVEAVLQLAQAGFPGCLDPQALASRGRFEVQSDS
ncbi:MAG: hypothetical protein HND55_14875 [Pseudomonadota bacterium]|nr:MAG: hypothetical protein HND55_14875 [Pseudomonadota bacterium]